MTLQQNYRRKGMYAASVVLCLVGLCVLTLTILVPKQFAAPVHYISPLATAIQPLSQNTSGLSQIPAIASKSASQALLAQNLQNCIGAHQGEFGIAAEDLQTGEVYMQNADEPFTMASTYKIPLVLTALIETEQGALPQNTQVGGSTLADAENRIITVSDNDLAVLLGTMIGWNTVQKTANAMGMNNTIYGTDFVTTPRDQLTLLYNIYTHKGISQNVRDQLIALLQQQQINDRIPKYLPTTAIVAHKTGELDDVRHDVGYVFDKHKAYIIVLMSKDLSNPDDEKEVLAKMSLVLYQYFMQ